MDPGSNEINPTGNTQSQTAGTLALTPSNSETPPYPYNLRNLPTRVTTTVQNTMNRTGPIRFKLPTEEIPEAELDDTKCGIRLKSAREYKLKRQPVAKTPCGRFFCIPCISKWKKYSTNCPSCGQAILMPGDARKLYMWGGFDNEHPPSRYWDRDSRDIPEHIRGETKQTGRCIAKKVKPSITPSPIRIHASVREYQEEKGCINISTNLQEDTNTYASCKSQDDLKCPNLIAF
ncbi:hypothetical protein JTE90_002958 [Oedothorax gibbosus]|uniref:RING-type domain-containing protein n=1 Tax=Oedothorax gibbosus TaxID=931172 RepID=A0AAV6VG50_9ARAC|nr:hypothetical protein JTE90_002958 [Oedothorax gibbosus]